MRKRTSAARAERDSIPAAANEKGTPDRRASIVELNLVELSPWLCDSSYVFDAAAMREPPLEAAGGGLLQRLADLLLTWLQRSRQRRQLAALSDNMLKDLGLSRADAEHEIDRRFWQD